MIALFAFNSCELCAARSVVLITMNFQHQLNVVRCKRTADKSEEKKETIFWPRVQKR